MFRRTVRRLAWVVLPAVVALSACSSGAGATSADGLLTKGIATLSRARSVHFREIQSGFGEGNTYESDVTADTVSTHGTSTNGAWSETILAGGAFYDRGSSTGGRWWLMPESARIAAEADTIPGTVRCLRAGHGHLVGVGSLNRAHVELADDGKAPGAAPTRWYLEVGKEVWLTRFVYTGPDRPGGPPHCGHARAGVTIDRSFTHYNAPVSITPPTDAVPAPPGTT